MTQAAGTVLDSSVLLDVFTEDPTWGKWSQVQLTSAAQRGALVLNAVVLAEIPRVPYVHCRELEIDPGVLNLVREVRASGFTDGTPDVVEDHRGHGQCLDAARGEPGQPAPAKSLSDPARQGKASFRTPVPTTSPCFTQPQC